VATGVEEGVVDNLPRFLDEALVSDNLGSGLERLLRRLVVRTRLGRELQCGDGGEGEEEAKGEGGAEESVAEGKMMFGES